MPKRTFRARCALALCCALFAPAACSGDIDGRRNSGSPVTGPGGVPVAGSGGAVNPNTDVGANDAAMQAQDPELFAIATRYFPGQSATGAPKRLFRLTRLQLDATARTLLPDSFAETALEALPRDPLQTNYEYAENLSWNAANFTPYTTWLAELGGRLRRNPRPAAAPRARACRSGHRRSCSAHSVARAARRS